MKTFKRFEKYLVLYQKHIIDRGIEPIFAEIRINEIRNFFRLTTDNPLSLSIDEPVHLYYRIYNAPINMNKIRKLDNLKGEELITKANELGLKKMADSTAEKYLNRVETFYKWLLSLGVVKNNPFSEFKPKRNFVRDDEQRNDFEEYDIERLLKTEIFSTHNLCEFAWIILIAIETGMRQNEISQLYCNDITRVSGLWCIYVNNERDDQRVKSAYSRRHVPLPQSLLRLGFIEFVESREGRLFKELTYCKKHGYSKKVSRWFSEYKKQVVNDDKKCFHSIRHYFCDKFKKADLPEDLVAEIKGQRHCKETYGRYGKRRLLKLKKSVLDKHGSKSVKKFVLKYKFNQFKLKLLSVVK